MLLAVDDLWVSYGRVAAVRGVSLRVDDGEIVALLGANGTGKSTTLRAICGMHSGDSGRVTFSGRRIERWSSDRIARLGISLVPEGRGLFPELTVLENLRMGGFFSEPATTRRRIDEVCAVFPLLGERLAQRAATLSGGEQQQLAIGRALVAQPRLLIIDEMSLGLAPQVVVSLYRQVEEINRAGTAVLLVEQMVNVALKISHRAYFLDRGEVTMSGPSRQFLDDTATRAYLGDAVTTETEDEPASEERVSVPLRASQTRELQRLARERRTDVGSVVADAIAAYLPAPGGIPR